MISLGQRPMLVCMMSFYFLFVWLHLAVYPTFVYLFSRYGNYTRIEALAMFPTCRSRCDLAQRKHPWDHEHGNASYQALIISLIMHRIVQDGNTLTGKVGPPEVTQEGWEHMWSEANGVVSVQVKLLIMTKTHIIKGYRETPESAKLWEKDEKTNGGYVYVWLNKQSIKLLIIHSVLTSVRWVKCKWECCTSSRNEVVYS